MMGERADRTFLERLPLTGDQPLIGYAATILLSGIAYLLRQGLTEVLPPGFPFVTFFPVVIVSTFLFGVGPGILAGVLCGIASMLFIAPMGTATIYPYQGVVAMVLYTFVVGIDIALIHLMQKGNHRLAEAREKTAAMAARSELLFAELQHRVSNNLQVVAALLQLQRRHIEDPAARDALGEAARRLALIGRIHRRLHDPSGTLLGIKPFLTQLMDELIDATGKPGIRSTVSADDGVTLDPDATVPFALIVAEAVTNAVEHGFDGRDDGHITLNARRAGQTVHLEICDDGKGLAPGFDVETSDSLGLRIARTLAQQLGGEFALERRATGTCASLSFPA